MNVRFMSLLLGGVIAAPFLHTSAFAKSEPERYGSYAEIPSILKTRSSSYKEQYISNILANIRQYGRTKMAIDAEDVKGFMERDARQRRISKINEFVRYDLDFNGEVTRDEIEDAIKAEYANYSGFGEYRTYDDTRTSRVMTEFLKFDVNGDQVVTYQEIGSSPFVSNQTTVRNSPITDLLALDPNSDGVLTLDELKNLAERAFATLDSDGDGIISQSERKAFDESERSQARQSSKVSRPGTSVTMGPSSFSRRQGCGAFPAPQTDSKILDITAEGGGATSTATLVGQSIETKAIPVLIEKGDTPLYIVANSSQPVIWQFSGATERVSHLVLLGPSYVVNSSNPDLFTGKVNVGVTGIDRFKVTFRKAQECLPADLHDPRRMTSDLPAKSGLERYLGRPSNFILSSSKITSVSIKSDGVIEPVLINDILSEKLKQFPRPDGFEEEAWSKFLSFGGAGVVSIRPSDVVSDYPVVEYTVLPQWAGISKLASQGQLRKTGDGYMIVQPIDDLPAGLNGALAAKFILADGVPQPKGGLGQSCLMSEKGQVLYGRSASCR